MATPSATTTPSSSITTAIAGDDTLPPSPWPSEKPAATAAAAGQLSSKKEGKWRPVKVARAVLDFAIAQWFVIGIGVVIALAHSFPNVARTGGILKAEYTIKFLFVAIIFFVSGLSLPLINLYKRAADWKLHLATHLSNFLLFPTIVFAIVSCVRTSDPEGRLFDKWVLAGMIVMGCVPTTVSSNVVMTGQAGGDQSAATIEVMLGNLIGTFLSPALLQMFCSAPGWAFGAPRASGSGGTTEIYRQVIEQLGTTVFVPLFVGEVLQYFFPKKVKWLVVNLKLAKVGSLCLLGIIWSTFSTAFYSNAFEALTGNAITFVLLGNIFIFILMSIFLFCLARVIPFPACGSVRRKMEVEGMASGSKLFDPETTVALLFCGPAKGIALGGPIVSILYGGIGAREAAIISLPLVLYQGSQVVLGQIEVALLKRWMRRTKQRTEHELEAGGKAVTSKVATDGQMMGGVSLPPPTPAAATLPGQEKQLSHPSDGLPRAVPDLPDSIFSMFSLKGKVSIVTGASGGIGFAVAEALAEAGSGVALLYNSTPIDEKAKALGEKFGVKCQAYKCAVTDLASNEAVVKQVVEDFGRVDVFVANAGGLGGGDIIDLTEQGWKDCMAINFDSVFYGAKAVGPYFKAQGSGSFIATTSISAHIVNNPINQAAYNSAKAGVKHFCKSLSRDWRMFARVNTVSPGFFETPMGAAPAVLPVLLQNSILGRQGDVRELKGAFLYFASGASTYTTGTDLLVDGGYTVC